LQYVQSLQPPNQSCSFTLSNLLCDAVDFCLSCRLSHEQLVEAARSSGQRKAYHAHLAPWPAAEQQAAAAAGAAAAQQQELVFGNGAGIAAAPADDVLLAQLQDVMAQ
jgi:hypothetical protein